jgi:diguanylate cyclase (GGDEF)-like protein
MKILIADSDPLFSRLLKAKLEKWGHSVFVEHDGKAAQQRIAKEPFRMVVLEWDLPGVSGPELCKYIRSLKRARYTYTIFYTDKTDKDSLMACLEAGADDYLTKPLNSVELRLRMRAGKRLLNQEDVLREGPGNDQSTGVVNGASFREFFRVILAENRRAQGNGTLMFVTITNYAEALSHFGYNPSESMMAEVAKLLLRVTRMSDLVARLSENTFCILLSHTFWDKCAPVAEKIEAQAQGISVIVDDEHLRPEVAVSAVNFPQDDMSYEDILDNAERMEYGPPKVMARTGEDAAAEDATTSP